MPPTIIRIDIVIVVFPVPSPCVVGGIYLLTVFDTILKAKNHIFIFSDNKKPLISRALANF
jgi:hypothetical protein